MKGETTLHNEKMFSISEPPKHWISKGKAKRPVDWRVPICILEEQHSFILRHEITGQGGDVDHAVPMVESLQTWFVDLRRVRFDRGFHSRHGEA